MDTLIEVTIPCRVAMREGLVDQTTKPGMPKPFWQTKTLDEMNASEWEQLCDGCGRCCLMKLEEEDTGEIFITRVTCKLLDTRTCQCSDYANRQAKVPDCIQIDPQQVRDLKWLPETCGYRRIQDGKPLEWWHPLVSGSPETVHEAGISVRGWVKSETKIKAVNLHRYIIGDYPAPITITEKHRRKPVKSKA